MRRWMALFLSLALVFSLTSGATAAPTLTLPGKARSVVVSVVGQDGEPLEKVAVQIMTPGTARFQIAHTNARGEAQLTLADGFSYWVRAWAKGYAVVERPYVPATDGPVITLTATPYNATLTGIVTDELGRPVPGVKISVWLANLGRQAETVTAADGTYVAEGLLARDGYTMHAEVKGFQPFVQADISLAAGARTQVDASLTPSSGPVTGEVINSRNNQPAAGVKVELLLNGWGVIELTTTDSFGYFYFAAPPWTADAYQIRLSADGFETWTSAAFAVAPGAWTNFSGANRIALNPLYAELSGSVVGPNGQAMANTKVELQRSDMGTIETGTTDENGFYLFTKLPGGTYRVRAVPAGNQEHGASDWVTLDGGDRAGADVAANEADLTSYGASAITGTVLDHLGDPVSGATVTAVRGTQTASTTTDAQGRYRLPVAANIEDTFDDPEDSSGYRVSVVKDGFIPTDIYGTADGAAPPALMTVRYRATNRADFTLQPATAQVVGRALNDRGLPLADVTVSLIPEGGGTVRRTVTDKTGRYLFADLPVAKQARYLPVVTDERYFESAMTPDGGLVAPATLPPGGVLTQSLTVRPKQAEFRGTAMAGTDKPAAGATVTLVSPADGLTWTAKTNANGVYSLSVPAVPGRQYLLRTTSPNTTEGTAPEAIDHGADYGVVANVAVSPAASLVGRVYLPDGQPAPNTQVALWMEGEGITTTQVVTDELGNYRFDNLTPGRRYSVAVWWGVNTWSTLAPGEAIITPLLSPGPGNTIRADLQAPAGSTSGQ
ncbi:MAG TPA: carboxypeptidase-like regulatory domain-containing protein [Symbiobacteriaceae bacterium]|nr:carboxypeptidase-like regulatory domain-containing protein [Symbiobacteriaceae bacterium]